MPSGAELFSASLQRLGVSHVFTLVGDHLNEVLQVLDRDGFTIVDLSQLVSGPLATMLLADQGATVVKVAPTPSDMGTTLQSLL